MSEITINKKNTTNTPSYCSEMKMLKDTRNQHKTAIEQWELRQNASDVQNLRAGARCHNVLLPNARLVPSFWRRYARSSWWRSWRPCTSRASRATPSSPPTRSEHCLICETVWKTTQSFRHVYLQKISIMHPHVHGRCTAIARSTLNSFSRSSIMCTCVKRKQLTWRWHLSPCNTEC